MKKVRPEDVGLTNYNAYATHYMPLEFVQLGTDIRAIPAGGSEDDWVQHGSSEYLNGWLYGAVQAACGQCQPYPPKPAGVLVSVAFHENEDGNDLDGATFLYTKEDWAHLDAERVKADFSAILAAAAHEDEGIQLSIYNWADFCEECGTQLRDAGYSRLREGLGDIQNVCLCGLVTVGLNCGYGCVDTI